MLMVYTDYYSHIQDDTISYTPAVKIGDGVTLIKDLPFIDNTIMIKLEELERRVDDIDDRVSEIEAVDTLILDCGGAPEVE